MQMDATTTPESISEPDLLKEFQVPAYVLDPESAVTDDCVSHVPQYPALVFVNSMSGGHLGSDLLRTYRSLLNHNQVR